MKNVYDILVNFKRVAYEFYEWNSEDEIKHIKVMPSFKVSDKCVFDFLENNVKVDDVFLEKIKDKTEVYCGRIIKHINYACIFYSNEIVLAILFDENGNSIGKSKLLFDEADDIIEDAKRQKEEIINYEVVSISNINNNLTRKENKLIFLLNKYLKRIFEEKSYEELKYFYFECYNDDENNCDKAYNRLKASIINAEYEVINKLKNLIKVVKK